MTIQIQQFEIDRIYLYEENPRHEPLQSQDEVIEHLCRDEQVLALAESICEYGTNPLEIIGVVKRKAEGKRRTKETFEVWEGNRRICAIKLLNDPDLAPPNLRPRIEKLAESYEPIRKVPGCAFEDHDRLRFWMANIHGGEQGGVGRRQWGAEAKARATGSTRNAVAQVLLDAAEALGYISKEDRRKRLTTLARYTSNRSMKEVLGIDAADANSIKSDRTDDDFKAMLSKLIADLVAGKITSRDNKSVIQPYARNLPESAGAVDGRIEPRPIAAVEGVAPVPRSRGKRPKKPKPPRPRTKIEPSGELEDALDQSGNDKLRRLYYSICDVSAVDHTLLIAVGAWALIECVSGHAGRDEETSFLAYYSTQRIGTLVNPGKQQKQSIQRALDRLSRGGNETKHSPLTGTFDAGQIIADMAVVTPLLVATLKSDDA